MMLLEIWWDNDEQISLSDVNHLHFISDSKINIKRGLHLLWLIVFQCITVSGVAEDNMQLLRSRSC